MKKMILALTLAALSGTAMAEYAPTPATTINFSDYARVVRVSPAYADVNRPVQVCDQVTAQPAPQGQNLAGEVIGGLVGGLAGHKVGKGRGNTAATIAGALGGAYVGGKAEGAMDAQAAQPTCRTEASLTRQMVGYRVTLQYGGRRFSQIMNARPRVGTRIPVRTTVTVFNQ